MKYRIKFSNGRQTSLRFHDWQNAFWFLTKVLKFTMIEEQFIKHDVSAEIVAQNGIPF